MFKSIIFAGLMVLQVTAFGLPIDPQQDSFHDPDGHLKTEHQMPANSTCMMKKVYEENSKRLELRGMKPNPMLQPCECSYSCKVDEDGNVIEWGGEKSPSCKGYCSKDGRKCACHPEEPCDMAGHGANAIMDMNHQVLAVSKDKLHAER